MHLYVSYFGRLELYVTSISAQLVALELLMLMLVLTLSMQKMLELPVLSGLA